MLAIIVAAVLSLAAIGFLIWFLGTNSGQYHQVVLYPGDAIRSSGNYRILVLRSSSDFLTEMVLISYIELKTLLRKKLSLKMVTLMMRTQKGIGN